MKIEKVLVTEQDIKEGWSYFYKLFNERKGTITHSEFKH